VPPSQLPIPAEKIENGSFLKSATPLANNKGGTYGLSVVITLTSVTEGAAIYYTIDGNTPTENSALYTSPITITQTATLKAIAVKDGMDNSAIMIETYTIPNVDDTTKNEGPIEVPTLRYETVPYNGYNLVYSAYDNTSYYYIFLLGKVKNTPLAYRQPFYYDGIHPIHISYSSASVSEESIGQSVQTAVERSVTNGTSTGMSFELEIKPEITILDIIEFSFFGLSGGTSSEWRRDETETRSTANTVETVMTKSSE
jgi:hypothetical protein